MGPGLLVTEHCLTRGVDDTFGHYINSTAVAYTLSFPTFEQFRVVLAGSRDPPVYGIHLAGHLAVGGEMTNFSLALQVSRFQGKTTHSLRMGNVAHYLYS